MNLSQTSAKEWEHLLYNKLWEKLSNYCFENIYLTAAHSGSSGAFNTMIDIKLRQWAEEALPAKSVESGWETLQMEFRNHLEKAKKTPDHDEIFDNLKSNVAEEAVRRHEWEDKAMDMLRVIQLNTLEDRSVHDKQEWDQACKFFEDSVKEKMNQTDQTLTEMFGPGTYEKWLKWAYGTEDQGKRRQVKGELDKILHSDQVCVCI